MEKDKILLITFPNNSRQLKKIINQILYKKLAKTIKRVNYTKSYKLVENKVQKKEEKLLFIISEKDKELEIKKFINEKIPESKILPLKNYM